jgi:ribonuclease P protein component
MSASQKLQKLRNAQQFRRVYDRGVRFNSPYFSAFFLKTDSGERRFGITVTRKIGGAVARNRCKRRLREVMKRYNSITTAEVPNLGGYDLVLNAKQSLIDADFKLIEESFALVMERAHKSLLKDL